MDIIDTEKRLNDAIKNGTEADVNYWRGYLDAVKAMRSRGKEVSGPCTTSNRLQEISQAEMDGRLVVLPCKVGDTIYQLRKPGHARGPGVSPRIVSCIEIRGRDYAVCHQGMEPCLKRDLGKAWFLTLQEAEEELRKEADNG